MSGNQRPRHGDRARLGVRRARPRTHRADQAIAARSAHRSLLHLPRQFESEFFRMPLIYQHDVDFARAVDAQSQGLLDIASAAGAGDQREVAAVGKDIRAMPFLQ